MPITEDQIKFYLSGGSSNSDIFASIGGPISTITQIRQDEFNNLWGDIGALDLKTGVTQYRSVYMKNESNNTVFENPRSYFAIKDPYVSIQWTKLGVNKRVAQLANERTAPPDAEVGSAGPPPPAETVKRFIYPSGNVTANGSKPGTSPENTNDSNFSTGWLYSPPPAWLNVDLSVTKYIHYVKLTWAMSTLKDYSVTFNIATSNDNTSFTTRFTGTQLITGRGSPEERVFQTYSFERHNARYVRVNIVSTDRETGEIGIGELEIYGVSEQLALDVGGWEGATEDLATTKSACPNVPPLSYIGLWLRRIIPPNDVAFPTLKQTMKLEVVGGGGTLPPSTEPPPVEPPPTEPPPTEPPPGGGGTGTGPYPRYWQTTRIYYSKRYQALSNWEA